MTTNVELASVATGADLPEGWNADGVIHAVLAHQIDEHRFESDDDAVLARHEGDEGFALFPSVDELMAEGVNLFALNSAFEQGLTGQGFAEIHASLDVETLNGALANFAEHHEFVATHSDPVDRALCLHGECDACS